LIFVFGSTFPTAITLQVEFIAEGGIWKGFYVRQAHSSGDMIHGYPLPGYLILSDFGG
jgi:hypothetical protein